MHPIKASCIIGQVSVNITIHNYNIQPNQQPNMTGNISLTLNSKRHFMLLTAFYCPFIIVCDTSLQIVLHNHCSLSNKTS